MAIKPYDRNAAVDYARRWAFGRNPAFYDFSELGGDCTNFVSQCIYAGACQMNELPVFGWYFHSPADRSPSWSGVEFLYDFLVDNMGIGPAAVEVGANEALPGDVIQLADEAGDYYHTMLLTGIRGGRLYAAAHTNDAYDRPLSSYSYAKARFLHITGVCYEGAVPVCPASMRV